MYTVIDILENLWSLLLYVYTWSTPLSKMSNWPESPPVSRPPFKWFGSESAHHQPCSSSYASNQPSRVTLAFSPNDSPFCTLQSWFCRFSKLVWFLFSFCYWVWPVCKSALWFQSLLLWFKVCSSVVASSDTSSSSIFIYISTDSFFTWFL